MYTTLNLSRHPLSLSTLFDNCGAIHLVNDKSLLDPGSFVKARGLEHVQAGSSSLPIIGRGTRVLKGLLNGARGEGTEDLTLTDVAVVEGFYVNIVSEARLLQSGVWYHGYDCSLRYGDALENVVLKKLERKFNLVFIEFKELSSCLNSPFEIPSLGTLMYPTIQKTVKRLFRSSRDYLKPRTDTEEKWHARAGHLGPKALKRLVKNARNMIIQGTSRKKCKYCAVTYATQVISRRPPEKSSLRPFWRVT